MNNPPVLTLLQSLRTQMQGGKSVSSSAKEVCGSLKDSYCRAVYSWLIRLNAGQDSRKIIESLPELTSTPARYALVLVIEKGLKGTPIDDFLTDLETEFYQTIESNYEKRLQVLPLKMMMPLMLFILPAMLLLLIGPLIFAITQSF